MMSEERTRFEVLLENLQTSVNVIAEAQGSLSQRLDRMETRFDARFDQLEAQVVVLSVKVDGLTSRVDRLETKVDGLETKVDGLTTRVDRLEGFATDAQRRLKRIETHLHLNGASARSTAKREGAPKRGRRS